MQTIGHAVAAVTKDVQPGGIADASFVKAAAEGVLFEGLASLLRQVLCSFWFKHQSLLPSGGAGFG